MNTTDQPHKHTYLYKTTSAIHLQHYQCHYRRDHNHQHHHHHQDHVRHHQHEKNINANIKLDNISQLHLTARFHREWFCNVFTAFYKLYENKLAKSTTEL